MTKILNLREIMDYAIRREHERGDCCKEEDELQWTVYELNNTVIKYNLRISVNKIKTMAMKREMNVRIKIVISSHVTEERNSYST
jgi:hypothetical protein